jgi:uncharacterized membrane protein YbhN (UPF0104 family)
MTTKRILAAVVVLLLAAAAVYAYTHGISFDFRAFVRQVRQISVPHFLIAVLLIYASFFVRSYRWAIFLRAHKHVGPFTLLGPQFIGFTAVALFGRIADLSRPFLVARKSKMDLSLQVAVYTVERMFDLGAAALIFSCSLALMPRNIEHHEVFVRVGVASLAGTLFLAGFCVAMRVAGVKVAALFRSFAGMMSPKFGALLEAKLLGFRDGLNAVSSFRDFIVTAALSLGVWGLIALAYVQTTHAFVAEPTLAHLSFARTMLLMAASIGGSLLQLPIIGWFTQIATTAAAMHGFYGTPLEPATACGALLLVVTFISVIPLGLIFARIESVSFGELTRGEATAERVLVDEQVH